MENKEDTHPHHPEYLVLHDETDDCCMCCNNTALSRDLREAERNKEYMTEEIYNKVVEDIRNFHATNKEKYVYYIHPVLQKINVMKLSNNALGFPTL